ncbi:MAG: hypothetical protein GWM88_03190 [Pseudomonadales bacterium]|nr:hypothetical protein [Pseudomonadales bacterium]NIX07075.1 hypothetical protein [Pseudomonadales bacterium]
MRAIAIITALALLAASPTATGDGSATGVRIMESQRYCQSARQCTRVETRCGGCDCGTAINEAFATEHQANLAAQCGTSEQAECERPCPETRPICVVGLCALEPLRGP